MIKVLKRNVDKQELKDFLYYGMSYDDKHLYQQVNESQANVFQFSGGTASGMIQKALPKDFDELTCLNALSRPGSSFSFDSFVLNGVGSSKYPEPISKYLKDSHGCILFQEQIMALVEDLSNGKVKGNTARSLLKSLGKANKKQEDLDAWEKLVNTIKEEAKDKLTPREIDEFTNDLLVLSAYSFNKSHASAYTYVACETLYMTKYFKPYFWASSLTYDATKLDVLKDSIQEAQKSGFKILPPDINISNIHFTPTVDGIRFGLNEIKGVGEEAAKTIVENRPYESIIDFIVKNIENKTVNKRITNALTHGGAFDNLIGEENRKYFCNVVNLFYETKKTTKTIPLLIEKWEAACEKTFKIETTQNDFMEDENAYLGGLFFHGIFSSNMQEKIEALYKKGLCLHNFDEIRRKNLPKQRVPVHLNSYRYHTQKNGKEMLFAEIEDCNGEKASIPIFANYLEHCKTNFFAEGFYFLDLYMNEDGKIMFGSKNWVKDPETIRNMMIRWKIS